MRGPEATASPTVQATLDYRSARDAPPRRRSAAVVTAITGIVALCIGFGFGAAAVGAAVMGDFGVVAAVSVFCALCFLFAAVMLLRRANELWGWVG